MTSVQVPGNNELMKLSSSLLSELKTSYPCWDDLVTKAGKFHSSLKIVIQSCAAFVDAIQKVADLASRTYGGSREIGTCLTRLCLRQRRMETKLKSMNNHLVTSFATPLSSKLDEWRRTLVQLEKDRARQTKRARADLKRAVSEASRWQKKVAKMGNVGSCDLGPGVGHGILPQSNSVAVGNKACFIAGQAANAMREVQLKTESVEAAEKSAVRGLMLEERGRFCFFLSCLLPILECQSSMLSELSAIDDIAQSLSKSVNNPNQLLEDAECALFRAGRGEPHPANAKTFSLYDADNSCSLIAAATAALYGTKENACPESSDTDSGRLTMDNMPLERKHDYLALDNCSLASSTRFHQLNAGGDVISRCYSASDGTNVSLGGVSSHSSSEGSANHGIYGSSRLVHGVPVFPGAMLGGTAVPINSTLDIATNSRNNCFKESSDNPLVSSCLLPSSGLQHLELDDVQFKTLCRHGNNTRTPSVTGSLQSNGHATTTSSAQPSRPKVDPAWLDSCDDRNDEDEADDDDEEGDEDDDNDDGGAGIRLAGDDDSSTTDDALDEGGVTIRPVVDESTNDADAGDYVEFGADNEEAKSPVNSPSRIPNGAVLRPKVVGKNKHDLFASEDASLAGGRHTISSAYERGSSASARVPISNLAFNPPAVAKSSSKDSGVDSSTVLYPNQALPPPVYTNLSQLAHAAQRKFSIPNLPPSPAPDRSASPLSSPSRSLRNENIMPSASSPIQHASSRSSMIVEPPDRRPGSPATRSVNRLSSAMPPDLASIRSVPHNLIAMTRVPSGLVGMGANRTSVVAAAAPSAATRPGSVGMDPFSMELDELDRLAGTAASRCSIQPSHQYSHSTIHLARLNSFSITGSTPFFPIPLSQPKPLPADVQYSSSISFPDSNSLYMSDSQETLSFTADASRLDRTLKPGAGYCDTSPLPRKLQTFPVRNGEDDHRSSTLSLFTVSTSASDNFSPLKSRQPLPPSPVVLASRPWSVRGDADARRPAVPPKPVLNLWNYGVMQRGPNNKRAPVPPLRRTSVLSSTSNLFNSFGDSVPANLHEISMQCDALVSHGTRPGSSCASSITAASSSTTSESQPSTTTANNTNNNGRPTVLQPPRARSVVASGELEASYSSQEINQRHSTASWLPPHHHHHHQLQHQHSALISNTPYGSMAISAVSSGPAICPSLEAPPWNANSAAAAGGGGGPSPASPTAIPVMSAEAASLMSELSSQLQQLTHRTGYKSPTNQRESDDGFELPPPPPASMFQQSTSTEQHTHYQQPPQQQRQSTPSSPTPRPVGENADPTNAHLSALKRSVEERAVRLARQDHIHGVQSRPV